MNKAPKDMLGFDPKEFPPIPVPEQFAPQYLGGMEPSYNRRDVIMRNSTMRKVKDLAREERRTVEGLLGRPLDQEETVSVRAYQTHEAPSGDKRDAAYRRLMERIDNTASRVKGVSEEQLDALIDDSVDYAHRHAE